MRILPQASHGAFASCQEHASKITKASNDWVVSVQNL
jgi:hypothetical protein